MAQTIVKFFRATKSVFQRRPLFANMVSFGTVYTGAEVSQQFVLQRMGARDRFDWAAVRRYAVIGIVGIAPPLFVWFRVLDKLFPSTAAKVVAKKVIVDQLVSSPTVLTIFFVGMSFLEGKEDLLAEYKNKFWPTYKLSCCFWLPAQALNFAFLPPYTRVAFVGTASFVWVNILCIIKRKVPETDS